ncbi:MAG TPA: peptidylprolyl isomerase [Candidatus Sulfotelmatobacter sp.]|nr:peptidylprolyl isomerase [Candidatus Sulfotelmatobacter sp.]
MRRLAAAGLAVVVVLGVGPIAAQAADPAPDRVLARVNQTEITYADLQHRVGFLERDRGPLPPQRYAEVLRSLVQEELLLQAALTDGLEQDPIVLERLGLARRQVLIDELLTRRLASATKVSDEELQRAYQENAPQFTVEAVSTRHILVETEAEADAIHKALEEGQDFAALAKAKSKDTGSADKGGDLGMLVRGQSDPEFEAMAFRLKDGELSPVIKTEYGYHILKGGPHGTVVRPLDEVRDQLQQALVKQKQQEAFRAIMRDLEGKAKTEVFEERLH